ncbi:hypothetical protein J437_LFUL009791 [Ladona fulva]|uniref:Uncharacterized protein n=1 Tax=Ladona fulva TaxID=123851 RepID=A0A8K0P2P6_LADFU|nr:hypothetical protein J437_LFUL009791 [Ladona fulva]
MWVKTIRRRLRRRLSMEANFVEFESSIPKFDRNESCHAPRALRSAQLTFSRSKYPAFLLVPPGRGPRRMGNETKLGSEEGRGRRKRSLTPPLLSFPLLSPGVATSEAYLRAALLNH